MRGTLVVRAWLALAASSLAGRSAGCPEPCACVDKYAQQFADCAYKDLEAVPPGLPSNVTTLSLSANRIAALPRGSFLEVTQVTSLWLAHNRIGAIEAGTLAPLAQLKNLDVSHNQIAAFPWEDLRNLSALQLLKMNNNRMAHLPAGAFGTLRDLRSLRVNNNLFAALAEGTFEPLASLSHLQIYNNPFDCSCALMWLKNWTESTLISIPERDAIRCAAPERLQGVPLARIPYLRCAAPAVHLASDPDLDAARLAYGAALTLDCQATGLPQPQVSWTLRRAAGEALELRSPVGAPSEGGGNEIPPESPPGDRETLRVFPNGTLHIPSLSKKEEGTYTCLAVNEVGRNQSSVRVAVALPPKDPDGPRGDPKAQRPTDDRRLSKNSVFKPEERDKGGKPGLGRPLDGADATAGPGNASRGSDSPFPALPFGQKCGSGPGGRYVSNHAFNQSGAALKPHRFDLGVIALDVSEREAKVELTPFPARPEGAAPLRLLVLCEARRAVQWSRVQAGVNTYWFRGLSPGTNYSVCLSAAGEACPVQVVFSTKAEVPSLLIIVAVSVFLLGLATVPLVGAACCHLLAKYQGQTYKLILKAQAPDPLEKRMAADFDPRASYLGSEPHQGGEGEAEEEEGEEEGAEEASSDGAGGSGPKDPPEECEVRSEYSDRLPLGAEAVTISEEINGNYKQPAR